MQLCLELGLDVNAVNEMGLPAVHGAANRGSDDIIELLARKRGARSTSADKEGRTPYVWAEGVFLATNSPVAKPSTMALLDRLTSGAASAAVKNAKTRSDEDRRGRAMTGMTGAPRRRRRAGGGFGVDDDRRCTGQAGGAGACGVAPVSAPDAAFLKQDLRRLPQRARQDRQPGARRLDPAKVDGDVDVWEKVVRKLRTGMMPPEGAPKPPTPARDVCQRLEAQLDRVAAGASGSRARRRCIA